MNSRERLLTALNNGKPDRLPCQVHSWMGYYLETTCREWISTQAYEHFKGMDWVIYVAPKAVYEPTTKWEKKVDDLGPDSNGNVRYLETYSTPEGNLTHLWAQTDVCGLLLDYMIKSEEAFELWAKCCSMPVRLDWTPVVEARERIGDKGIVRGGFGLGHGGPSGLQLHDGHRADYHGCNGKTAMGSLCFINTLQKKIKVYNGGGTIESDIMESGSSAASSTVISPDMYREFCLPYNQKKSSTRCFALWATGRIIAAG